MSCEEKEEEISWNCWLRTILAGFGAMTLFLFLGLNESQSSVMLPQLRRADSIVPVTPREESWIASLGFLMAPVSAVVIGPFIDVFGRRRGLQFFYLSAGLGYAVISCAREVYHIYIGRIICGMGTGQITVGVVYLAEICTIKQREYSLSVLSSMLSCGVVLSTLIGGYLAWNKASLIYSVVAFMLFIGVSFIPESPAWLFRMGREDDSIRSLQSLGRSKSAIQRELDDLQKQRNNVKEKIKLRTFLQPTVWKPFLILTVFYFLQSGSGIYDLLYYAVDFFSSLGTTYDPLALTVALSFTRLVTSSTIVFFFRSRVSRRFSLAFSGFWMAVALTGLGTYEYVYSDVRPSEKPFQWLPIVSLFLYMMSSSLGMLGLVSIMTGELYPLKVRGVMTGISVAVGNCFMFLSVKIYGVSVSALQIDGLVFSYAALSLITVFFAIFILPETQNKTLYEIEQGFLPKTKRQEIAKITIDTWKQINI